MAEHRTASQLRAGLQMGSTSVESLGSEGIKDSKAWVRGDLRDGQDLQSVEVLGTHRSLLNWPFFYRLIIFFFSPNTLKGLILISNIS